MTDWAVIATIIAMGVTVIGIQLTTFLYLLRRLDAMQREISETRADLGKEISETRADLGKEISETRLEIRDARVDFEKGIGALSERVARLEGILIGRLEIGDGAISPVGDD